MLHSSIPVGRFLGVEIRLHISFPVLLLLAITYSLMVNHHMLRGIGLWLALCFAVVVRETARAIAAAYAGLRLRAIFLLPVGGVMAFAPRDRNAGGWDTRAVTAAGPVANVLLGLIMLGMGYAIDPHVSLLAPPWIGVEHVLRSFIWTQFILGVVGMLPASALTSRQLLRGKAKTGEQAAAPQPVETPRPAPMSPLPLPPINLGTVLGFTMILAGFIFTTHLYLVVLGGFVLLFSQLGSAQPLSSPAAESIQVHEVMLTEYTLLAASDTLQGALDRTVHSLQDVFPIVRGDRLVGSVARQTIADRLVAEGDGYLQGIMTRTLQIASPSEKLVEALRRAAAHGASEFIPVVDDNRMLGILTPQSLTRAVQQVTLSRPLPNGRRSE